MARHLRVDGKWPEVLSLSSGWFKATARPWNDDTGVPMVRLVRGGADFLDTVTNELIALTGSGALSPALYHSSTRVWCAAGYEPYVDLTVMEKILRTGDETPRTSDVSPVHRPDWVAIDKVDRSAFEGFWRMSAWGLQEAMQSTQSSVVLAAHESGNLVGYAVVGAQRRVGYLHRIAVAADHQGRGLGSDLLRQTLRWARLSGASSMVLNVRKSNRRAARLYTRHGFTKTPAPLRVLRKGDIGLLN